MAWQNFISGAFMGIVLWSSFLIFNDKIKVNPDKALIFWALMLILTVMSALVYKTDGNKNQHRASG